MISPYMQVQCPTLSNFPLFVQSFVCMPLLQNYDILKVNITYLVCKHNFDWSRHVTWGVSKKWYWLLKPILTPENVWLVAIAISCLKSITFVCNITIIDFCWGQYVVLLTSKVILTSDWRPRSISLSRSAKLHIDLNRSL